MSFKLIGTDADVISNAFTAARDPIVRALFLAMLEVTPIGRAKAAARIVAAGLGQRMANAMFARAYENKGFNAAATFVNKVSYSGVFEHGATIRGSPLLWLPLSTTPERIGFRRTTPKLYAARYGDLFSVNRPGMKPLLFGHAPGKEKPVPLFIGERQVTIAKKVDVQGAIEEAAALLPKLVEKHLKDN